MTIIGIDIGNKYTKVYRIKNGKAEAVFTESSERKFLSTITLKEEERIFGKASAVARNYTSSFHELLKIISNPQINEILTINHESLYSSNPEVHLLVIFLNYIKNLVNSSLIECVISVSSDLNSNPITKKLLKYACKIVDFNLLGIINTNLASSLGYCFFKILQNHYKEPSTALFYNIGDSHSNFSLIRFHKNTIQQIANTNTPTGVGCIDSYLLNLCTEHIKTHHNIDLTQHSKAYISLLHKCQKSKQILSTNSETYLNTDFFLPQKEFSINLKITQEMINSYISENILPPLIDSLQKLIEDNNISQDISQDISLFVPSGGGSRIPIISQTISDYLNSSLHKVVDLDESIAKGCALYGGLHSDNIKTGADIKIKYRNQENILLDFIGTNEQIFKQVTFLEKDNYYPIEKLISFKKLNLLNSQKILVFDSNHKKLLSTIIIPEKMELLEKDTLQIRISIDSERNILLKSCKIKHQLSEKELQVIAEQEELKKIKEEKDKLDKEELKETHDTNDSKTLNSSKMTETKEYTKETIPEETNDTKDSKMTETKEDTKETIPEETNDKNDSKITETKEDTKETIPEETHDTKDSKKTLNSSKMTNESKIKPPKKYRKINVSFKNQKYNIYPEYLEDIKSFESTIQQQIEKKILRDSLLNTLESNYYRIQENLISPDSEYCLYLNQEEKQEIQNIVEKNYQKFMIRT